MSGAGTPGAPTSGEQIVGSADADASAEPDADGSVATGGADTAAAATVTVEDLLDSLEAVTAERDRYLDQLQRLQAEFDNFRKRTLADTADRIQAGVARLAEAVLPVLDASDAAVAQGDESAGALGKQLMVVLEKEGLDRIATVGEAFDPNVHEAVLHEAGDADAPVVSEELRAGYRWGQKVLRPAMVKVAG